MTTHSTQQETYIHTPGRIRTRNPSKRADEDPRLTPAAFRSVCSIWCSSPQWATASSFMRFLHHTQRRTTVGRTPLDKGSATRRDLYLTTHTRLTRDIYPYPGIIRTRNPRKRLAAAPRFRPRGHRDHRLSVLMNSNKK